ncbi:hypothetical protein B0H34DRAFT_792215 [Crassisporium funariophilum]|nr:hypothetical protein B0H34DRAFT_792215 [Crassisporium funariophilum]
MSIDAGHKPDLGWETYVVEQGIRLCFKQDGEEDVFVDVPKLAQTGKILTLQPWAQAGSSVS